MGKGGSQTIGYHYLFDLVFGIGRGPLNGVTAIKAGDKVAWQGSVTDNDTIPINKPDLFGGEQKEGGIQGVLGLYFGAADQVLPGDGAPVDLGLPAGSQYLQNIKTLVGDLCSDFRGVVTAHFSGIITSMNPYPKEWKFRVWRTDAGWQDDTCWYPEKALIVMGEGTIHAMNPAHIIYECYTNKSWGRGLPASLVDGEDGGTFVGVANQLCSEGFGLCFMWQRQDDVSEFVNSVLEHIGGVAYLDRNTGKMALRLIRNDYDPETLPVFTPSSGLLEITEDDSSSQDASFNEMIVTGRDPITDLDIQVRVPNLAARHSQGAANADSKNYLGAPTKSLLLRIAQRDLRMHASGLKKFTVILDRRGYEITPGMPFRIQDTRRGIGDMVLRAGEIVDGELRNGRITVKAMQDVFALPDTSFVTPGEGTWEPPSTEALPAAESIMLEAGHRDIVRRSGQTVADALADDSGYIGVMGLAPNATSLDYDLRTRVSTEPSYTAYGTNSFTGTAALAADIEALDTEFVVTDASGLDSSHIGEALWIGDQTDGELLELVDFDDGTLTATVTRGNGDTVPKAHVAGTLIWTIDDDLAADGREYVEGEIVQAKLLTRTSSDLLTEAEATTETVTITARQARPYPPGDFQIDGVSVFEIGTDEHNEPVLTWVHRDRILQMDQLIAHGEAGVGPEDGTTYTVRIYELDGVTLLRTEDAIAGTTFTYDATMQGADGAPVKVYIELESERDGLASWQKYRVLVTLTTGYGLGYGYNYGGA